MDQCVRVSLLGCLVAAALGAQAAATTTVSYADAARFLEQASWGPTPSTIAAVQRLGYSAYLDAQMLLPASAISDVPPNSKGVAPLAPMQQQFFANAIAGQDQLRQRVAFALGQIWVTSGVKLRDASEMVPYLRLLSKDAFENYATIMRDVTLSPAMGHYLDMVNNDKPNAAKGTRADENYARELMQLFTIGLDELNVDGTARLDAHGNTIPTYGQDTIEAFARAFTGWTYAPLPGAVSHMHNPANFAAPMVVFDANHDTDRKALLNGETLPGGQTAEADLRGALTNVFHHANVGPFVCRQLIQHLVTSQPSPAYVERVARVFADNGQSVRGDMKAVVRAILLDGEARTPSAAAAVAGGHLREPVVYVAALLRALNATVAGANGLAVQTAAMGQDVYLPPTVFNYFSPGYVIPGTAAPLQPGINAPEFQILSTATALTRVNFANTLVFGKGVAGVGVNWTPWSQLAATPDKLLTAVDEAMMRGQMPGEVMASILRAVNAAGTPLAKAQTAIYLAATSNYWQVEH